MIREHYGIPRKEGLSLKDYPTIRHCVRFVMENAGGGVKTDFSVDTGMRGSIDTKGGIAEVVEDKVSDKVEDKGRVGELNEKDVLETIIKIISDKTGYSGEMLDPDLDMEADLGIDTVKQAELFGMIREHYGIPRKEGLSLKDYPTIRHCVRFVMENAGGGVKTDFSVDTGMRGSIDTKGGIAEVVEDKVSDKVEDKGRVGELNEKDVLETIIKIISDKTGYSREMLDPDLDMEADLGIDTVKQAELFGMIREHYGIPRKEGLSLKDYPTIRHCVRFVMENAGKTKTTENENIDIANVKVEEKIETTTQFEPIQGKEEKGIDNEFKVDMGKVLGEIDNKHTRHIRYKPTIVEMPVRDEIIKKFDPSKYAVIIADDIELAKLVRNEFSKLGVLSIILTSKETKLKDSYTVNFSSLTLTDEIIRDIASKYKIGGIVYLMGVDDKKLDENTKPSVDVNRYVMPLFVAAKHFAPHLNDVKDDFVSFIICVTKIDGGFGYITTQSYDPIYGGIYGVGLCLRKEFDKSVVKVIDFPKDAENLFIVKKIFYELQYSDKRCAVSYSTAGKRYTLVALPVEMRKDKENYTLSKKKIIVTGGGRGLGALFCKMASKRWKPTIIILDIIELSDEAAKFASMSEDELVEYKNNTLKEKLKKIHNKLTPVMLEKEFTRIKDSANLYKTIKEIEALGAKVFYYQCDLNNSVRFEEVMRNIKDKFGMVDGFIHFAGLERSKLSVDKSFEEFLLIFNTKANSAINIWRSQILREDALVVMVSSIAGKFGNLGQTDYAAASDYISKFAVNLFNQKRKAFAIDMTAIANIGMGVRPGVEAFLKSQEVEFLYPEEVMGMLCDEISYGDIPEIIYSGSLGKLDWDKQLAYEKNFPISTPSSLTGRELYFLEKIEKNSPSSGFLAVKNLSVKEKYLDDHSINDVPLLPGVMGIEAFAEAICAYKSVYPVVLKNIEFKLPVKLLKRKDVEIKIEAWGGDVVNLAIRSDFVNAKGVKMGETRTHFTAIFEPSEKNTFRKIKLPDFKKRYKTDKQTIYKTYFHGPSFQVLDGIIEATRNEVIAVFQKPQTPLLGDRDFDYIFHPLIIEALFQTCGWRDLYIDSKMTLPDSVESVKIVDNKRDPEKLFTYAVFKGLNNFGKSVYDAWAFDENGVIYAEILNYVMIGVNII